MKTKNYHVYPVNDKLPHETNRSGCICHPKIEIQPNGNKLVIHNSFDCRELKENPKSLLIN